MGILLKYGNVKRFNFKRNHVDKYLYIFIEIKYIFYYLFK